MTLSDAITATNSATQADHAVLKLLKDIDQGSKYAWVSYGVFTIDLNGKTLRSSGTYCLFLNGNRVNVTIIDSGEGGSIIGGIAAKNLSENIYVAAVYSDGTTTWTSGVQGYSIGAYCGSLATKGGTMADLAMATAVYGYHAKQYFGG